jgi:hypothetical protein
LGKRAKKIEEIVQKWHIVKIANGIYQWTLGYDSFLGYMRGVVDIEKSKNEPPFC